MDATHVVARIARAIQRHKLDAVMIGNAAAAMQGAPVTTIDIDFLVRQTRANTRKLAAVAFDLGATLYRPFYPVSRLVRLMNDDETLQVDFMSEVSGIRSFEGLRNRAVRLSVEEAEVCVAGLADIIKMKKAADRPKDRAVLEILEKTLEEIKAHEKRATRTAQKAK